MQKHQPTAFSSIVSIVITCLVLLLPACDQQKTSSEEKKRNASPLPVVEMAVIDYQQLNHHMHLTGTLEPKRLVHLYNQTPGLIISLPFYEGDKVKRDETLAQLDDVIIQSEYNQAKANYRQSKLDYGRLETLSKKNLTSKELLTRAETKVELDQSEYELQKKRLSYTQIKAPWDGIISERLNEPGDVLPLHTHFMTLIDVSNLIVKVLLSELYLPLIKINDPITFKIDALGSKEYTGQISRIYPQVNSQTRKGVIEVMLTDVPNGALPGQLTRISLTTAKEKVLVVPLSAIRYDQQGAFVYKINADKSISRTTITTGKKFADYIEVLDGLQAQDRVVKKGLFGLRSGKKVKIITPANE